MPESSVASPAVVTKRHLTLEISAQTGLSQVQVLRVIYLFTGNITDHLAAGNSVVFRSFGAFEVKVRKAKTGRDPRRPSKAVRIPARTAVKFSPGKEMKERVLLLTPPPPGV